MREWSVTWMHIEECMELQEELESVKNEAWGGSAVWRVGEFGCNCV